MERVKVDFRKGEGRRIPGAKYVKPGTRRDTVIFEREAWMTRREGGFYWTHGGGWDPLADDPRECYEIKLFGTMTR